ncbi:MAG TPA: hypothetical protein VG778_00865 [Blastocatellia bacterium]|jgi:hypothetical protein|nr:hypothetical protein [Blastocatellia bacterium]
MTITRMARDKAATTNRKSLIIAVFAGVFLVLSLGTSAHEPITTKVRFNREVVRMLQRSCLGCHRTDGAAMSLETYEEARPWAKAIKEEILEKRMPPWHAVKGYGEFINAPPLTQHEIDVIVNWVEGGAPKGDDKELPREPLVREGWQLGKPSLTLKANKSVIAAGADEHRTFVLQTRLKQDRWISAIDVRPDTASVVHCVTISLDDAGAAADAIRRGAQKASINRLTSSNQISAAGPMQVLAKWVPGQKRVAFPEGAGQLLPAGSRVVLDIHYKNTGESAKDQSEVGFYFSKTPARRQVQDLAITQPNAVIPAGAAGHRIEATAVLQEDSQGLAIRPYAHPLLVSLQATAYLPDGTQQVLIWVRGHRSDWQPTYYFKQPVSLPKQTRIEVVAHFDNSENNNANPNDPPKQVRWSELTPDPICLLLVANTQ